MSNPLNKDKINETTSCCCVDVGSVIDNEESMAEYSGIFETESLAQEKLDLLTQQANKIASDPCQITHSISKVDEGYELSAKFNFCCGAESLIFQFKLR